MYSLIDFIFNAAKWLWLQLQFLIIQILLIISLLEQYLILDLV